MPNCQSKINSQEFLLKLSCHTDNKQTFRLTKKNAIVPLQHDMRKTQTKNGNLNVKRTLHSWEHYTNIQVETLVTPYASSNFDH